MPRDMMSLVHHLRKRLVNWMGLLGGCVHRCDKSNADESRGKAELMATGMGPTESINFLILSITLWKRRENKSASKQRA